TSERAKKALEAERQRQKEEALARATRNRHITSVILFAVGIFLTLCAVIPGTQGEGWHGLFDFMHGMFGYSSYLVGPAMIYIAVLLSANRPAKTIRHTVIALVLLVLMVSAAVQILSVGAPKSEGFFDFFGDLYVDGYEFRGGGILALIVGEPLLLLGQVGASIIIILLALVYFLIISKITVVDFVHRLSDPIKKTKDKAVEHHKRRAEQRALAEEEFERLEQERLLEQVNSELEEENNVKRLQRIADDIAEDVKLDITPDATGKSIIPEEKKPEPPNILQEQTEESKEYMRALQDFIMDKNKAVIEADHEQKKDPLEDADGELVPILDAINKFNADTEELLTPVKKIVDAPVEAISTSDEAELPFDIDDVVQQDPPKPMSGPIPVQKSVQPVVKPFQPVQPVQPVQPMKPSASIVEAAAPVRAVTGSSQQVKLSEVYTLPPVTLLNPVEHKLTQQDVDSEIKKNSQTLVDTLKSFGVQTKIVGVSRGPSVTRYELQPAPGVKISKITNLVDDIALNLAAAGVRIEAPIPNKAAVGIEVPNKQKDTVFFRELVDTPDFKKSFDKKLETVLGKDIGGNTVTCNVAKMPHLLIAGTTGSGKSVCVNSIIMSILMKSTPEDVRLIMVDPKKVEFMMYNGIPHLLIPVVTDAKKAAGALAWAVNEMLNRYKMFSENNVRDFGGYNELASDPDSGLKKMSHIVIFIDELADLMMASPKDVEDSIVRLAQMARAAGMHLVIATQRPTVNVVTGLIKANIPSRIALMVASQMDSRVILDSGGAEKLLGNGDMLYMPVGMPKPVRVQGCFVSDKEVERIVEFIKQTFAAEYDESIMEEIERQTEMVNSADGKGGSTGVDGDIDDTDEKLEEAIGLVVEAGVASTSSLQRALKLGYGRAARLIDTMEKMGVVGPFEGSKPRQVLMTKQEWYERKLQQK
ncbi:MAG: DNA translocase FtsK, partial [Oscillospiraceae bacterium]|nr:DNA translocase FtsK [Oscillospiraceae bacterium]